MYKILVRIISLACFPELIFCAYKGCRGYQPLLILATGKMLWKIGFEFDSLISFALIFWFQSNSPWLKVSLNSNKEVRHGGRRADGRSWNVKWWGTGNHAHTACKHLYLVIDCNLRILLHKKKIKYLNINFPPFISLPTFQTETLLFYSIWIGIQVKILTSQDLLDLFFGCSDDLSHISSK